MFLLPRSSQSSSRAVYSRCLRIVIPTTRRCGARQQPSSQRFLATAAPFQPLSTSLKPPFNADCDVLIIGAGPAGLITALGLSRAGIKVRLVDKRSPDVIAGHGDGLQPRTLEILQSYGLSRRILDEANQMHAAAFYNPGPNGIERIRRESDVTCPRTLYPFKATLGQGRIEQILADALAEHGVRIERPSIPLSLTPSPCGAGVQVEIQRCAPLPGQPDQETIRASYVIGADGAHSWVRKQLGFTMDGEHTDWIWGVLDTYPKTDFPDIRNRVAIHSKHGSCMIIPREGDKVRLYIQLGELPAADPNSLSRGAKPALEGPEYIMDVARKCLQPYTIEFPEKIDWWTHYIIGQRVASSFSKDRVFIVGDACHTHSPKAGQGMNAGMGDAHNLAWKLAHVIKGYAKPDLLATYEAERRKYAQELIDFDRKFAALFSGKARTAEHLDGVTHEEFLRTFQMFGGFTSGVSIGYSPSLIVKPFEMSNISTPTPNLALASSHHSQSSSVSAAHTSFHHNLHSPPHTQAGAPTPNLPRRAVHAQVPLMPPSPSTGAGAQLQARAVSSSATRTLAVPFEETQARNFDALPAVTLPTPGLPCSVPSALHRPTSLERPTNTTMQHPMLGYRVPPQIVVRAADFRPVQLQELVVSDGKFKILVFVGSALVQLDSGASGRHARQGKRRDDVDESLSTLSDRFEEILNAYGAPLDVFSVVALKAKELDRHIQLIGASGNQSRGFFRGGWRNVFSDDRTISRTTGGDAFLEFGIAVRSSGAIFVVRPDGYVGLVSDLTRDGLCALDEYLSELQRAPIRSEG